MRQPRPFVVALATTSALASFAAAEQIRIDFGSPSFPTPSASAKNWNNVTNPTSSASTSLLDYASGSKTPWTLSITNPFLFATDPNGTRAPRGTALDMGPVSASRDAFQTIGSGQLVLRNLSLTDTYNLSLFASSSTWSNAKGTYTATGATRVSGTLDAYKNDKTTLSLSNLKPAPDGTIKLDVGRSGLNIGYLNELTLTSVKPTPTPPPAATAKNLLFFGNSFTKINDVPSLVGRFAVADGKPQPYVVGEVLDNRELADQIDAARNAPQNNVDNLPLGKQWDDVVMQEYSNLPTHVGDPAAFRADAATLYGLVKAKSPNVKPVLYETWAYRPDSTLYAASPTSAQFASAAAMQAELRANYKLAKADLDALDGGTTLFAGVGDKWEQAGFPADFYDTYDDKHPNVRGSTLAALVLYATIYNENVKDIPFASVQSWATPAGLTQADWTRLTTLVDTNPAAIQGLIAAGVSPAYLVEALVPEPTTLAAVGTLGVVMSRRRR